MRFLFILVFQLIVIVGNSQNSVEINKHQELKNCQTENCKITKTFLLAEYFLETDDIQSSQKWLNAAKDLVVLQKTDTTSVFIHSLQSELFYYDGLFQFGTNEAEKAIQNAKQLKDSLLIANGYFFKGINLMEINNFSEAEKSLWKSRNYQPNTIKKQYIRSTIEKEHIYNNLAQLKLKVSQSDSAVWYNSEAYYYAKKANSKRGIPNVEQTFGQIYLEKNKMDSAIFYFEKSTLSAQKSEYFDIVLLNYGFLMHCYENNPRVMNQWFDKGIQLINQKIINSTFQHYFYDSALTVFKKTNQTGKLAYVQEQLILINNATRLKGNLNIQNITAQYAKNENKLLLLQVEELKKQRNFVLLQQIAALLSVIILSLVIFIIRRKNKIQKTLRHQKNEISKDLHDDIGSGLSSILIHADLLLKNETSNEKQKVLASKIDQTGKEISQRLNAFIWSLNSELNTLQHFCEYTKQYGANLFEETPISFHFHNSIKDNEMIKMNGQQRKNLFYALKEILNNTLKHAQASKVDLYISLEANKQLQLIIQDNGTGIIKENSYGNGIKNIQNRVEQLSGTFFMETKNGLLTTLKIPL
jgi:signal transduction histidine kinase